MEAIKPEELMKNNILVNKVIGKEVLVNGYYGGTIILKNLDEKHSIDLFEEHIDDLKPIPLTEQWLIDFGFEKFEFQVNEEYQRTSDILFKKELRSGEHLIVSCDKRTPISFPLLKDEHTGNSYYLRGITNIHTLQNLWHSITNTPLKLNK